MTTVIAPVKAALLAAIATQLPDVQVLGQPPAEDAALRESIWVETITSEFEWRSLGRPATHGAQNRKETLTLEMRISVYREGANQVSVADQATARCEELFGAVEAAFQTDPSLASSATHALITRWQVTPVPRESGWAVDGRLTVEAENYPT